MELILNKFIKVVVHVLLTEMMGLGKDSQLCKKKKKFKLKKH